MSGFGVNSKLTYMFKDKLNNQLTFSVEFLSGDDPDTEKDEMFDVLWGRWPYWSETGLYSYAAETRVGQQANLLRLGPSWNITPAKNLDFTAGYYLLLTQEEYATRGAPGLFSNDSTVRGHFATAVLKYKFNQHVAGHLWGEVLFPGDYYVHKEVIPFLRAEIYLTL